MRVAVLGTGIMGAPMARNVRAAGHGGARLARRAEAAGVAFVDAPVAAWSAR